MGREGHLTTFGGLLPPIAQEGGRHLLKRDYYLILGVSQEESQDGIQRAFRRLVKRYHPDMVGLKWTTRYQDIVEAYQILSDPERRESYNRSLGQAEDRKDNPSSIIITGYRQDWEPIVPEPVSLIHDFQTSGSPLESLFDRFIRNYTGREVSKAEQLEGLTAEIILSPDEALHGGRLPLNVPVAYPCPTCDGTGEIWPFHCSHCRGKGLIEEEETVMISTPSKVQSGSLFEIPLRSLGIHNIYLKVLIRIGSYL
jgi:molecular chaperone DnaJ